MSDTNTSQHRVYGLQLFALSFVALFLELMLIRWVPAVVRMVAYYANLMLISSFLGLGVGALLARRRRTLFAWFPLLLVIDVGILLACGDRLLAATDAEARFFAVGQASHVRSYLILLAVFIANTALFVPIGQRIGQLFDALPALRAYSWDLAGSLAGTLCFGAFSLLFFSPLIGMSVVGIIYLVLARRVARLWGFLLLPVAVAGVVMGTDRRALWSPYHYITIVELATGWPMVSDPPPDLHTSPHPPIYWVRIGRDFYQGYATLVLERYTDARLTFMRPLRAQYMLPYEFFERAPRRVAVMGAGGGMDVQAALLASAEHVDAVEIDPMLVTLSKKFNSSGVYLDPRVTVHVGDARAFLRRTHPGYDAVIFGFLDSQSLFTSMSNLRMDSYVYTIESIRTAYDKLADDGVLSLSFAIPVEWMAGKVVQLVREATGVDPVVYVKPGAIVVLAFKGKHRPTPDTLGDYARAVANFSPFDLPTDDWPYLYLLKRTIPTDYLLVIGTLLALSIGLVGWVGRVRIGRQNGHFFFLGMGFLLLQTKSITDCSLYFGTTWLVSNIVIAGVLLMVLAANVVATRLPRASAWYYFPLLASLMLLYIVPRDLILAQPFAFRLTWAMLVVPLPIFFAGLIFSTTFRESADRSSAFGSNLIGATVGGFCEYLGMAVGTHALSLIVIGAYVASWAAQILRKREIR